MTKIMFQVRSFPCVQTVIVTRESETNYWVQSGDREVRIRKGGFDGDLFSSFEAARVFGFKREQDEVARKEWQLAKMKERLVQWGTMNKARPPEQPFKLPQSLDLV